MLNDLAEAMKALDGKKTAQMKLAHFHLSPVAYSKF